MQKTAREMKAFRSNEAAPKFLFFLKNKRRSSLLDGPAKSSRTTEAAAFLLLGFVIVAIIALVVREFGH